LDSTGRVGEPSRRGPLRLIALTPLAACLPAARAEATDYASPLEALDAIDALEADVAARLAAIGAEVPAARAFVESLSRDHARHREDRRRIRRRLGLGMPSGPGPGSEDADLAGLRAAQEALVYAHAEGLPALADPSAVDTLARHMVELSRHLTVIDLWLEGES
jgi:hypothetical protein